MKVLGDTSRIDHTVVPQDHTRLPIEKRHVAVDLEELPPDRLAAHLQPRNHLSALNMLVDDLLQVLHRTDSIQDLVRLDQDVRARFFRVGTAGAKAACSSNVHLFQVHAVFLQQPGQCRLQARTFLPTATVACTAENFECAYPLDRPVEYSRQYGLAVLNVARENLMHQFAVDSLIFDGYLARHKHAHNRLPAAASGAASLMEHDIIAAGGDDMLAKLLHHNPGTRRVFTGRRPDLNHNRIPGKSFPPTGFGLIRQLLERCCMVPTSPPRIA